MSKTEKYIGIVKWFHDHAKNADYGFIQHSVLGDLFFHKNSIESGQNIDSFRENEVVVFSIKHRERQINIKTNKFEDIPKIISFSNQRKKEEAINVLLLSKERDETFLIHQLLSNLTKKNISPDYNTIQKCVYSQLLALMQKRIDNKIINTIFPIFQNYIISNIKLGNSINEEYIKELLKVCKAIFPDKYRQITDIIEKAISEELAHKLWLEGFIETCQINFIAGIILSATLQTKRKIFDKCSKEDKLNIFFKVLYSYEKIDTEPKIKIIKEFLNLSKEFSPDQHEKILNATIKVCPDHFKLNLWLEDYHDNLDFNSYKLYTITLSPEDQKKFVKKVLKYIHEGQAIISVEELTSLNVIDFETSKLAEHVDESHLDYSTSIILNVISELKNKTNVETRKDKNAAQHRIYDIILKKIKEPKDILEITGYFDECGGRCSVSVYEEKNERGEVINRHIIYDRNEHNKAKNHPICDGRLAINQYPYGQVHYQVIII